MSKDSCDCEERLKFGIDSKDQEHDSRAMCILVYGELFISKGIDF